jgi:hypothetical protein
MVLLRAKKSGISNFCQFWKIRYSSSFIVIFFDTIPADSLNIFYTPILLFQVLSSFYKGRFWLELFIK